MIDVLTAGGSTTLNDEVAEALRESGMAVNLETPRAALAMALLNTYDVIVLSTGDVEGDDLDSFRLCAMLRALAVQTPIIIVGLDDAEWLQLRGFEVGADEVVVQGEANAVLIARVHALSRRPDRLPNILRVDDLVIDPARSTCRRSETDIHLNGREFAVLLYLMHRPGLTVSKADLYRAIWRGDPPENLNVVEVTVSSLRKKVDAPFDHPLIQTAYGFGYRIIAPN